MSQLADLLAVKPAPIDFHRELASMLILGHITTEEHRSARLRQFVGEDVPNVFTNAEVEDGFVK